MRHIHATYPLSAISPPSLFPSLFFPVINRDPTNPSISFEAGKLLYARRVREVELRGKLARDEDDGSSAASLASLLSFVNARPLFPRLFPLRHRYSTAGDIYNNDSVNYLSSRALSVLSSRVAFDFRRVFKTLSFVYINLLLIYLSFVLHNTYTATENSRMYNRT